MSYAVTPIVDLYGSQPEFILAPTEDLFVTQVLSDPDCRIDLRGCIDLEERKNKIRTAIADHFDIWRGSFGFQPLSSVPHLASLLADDEAA